MPKGLTNQYLNSTAKRILKKSFLGVFPSDIHPSNYENLKSFSIIFNTGDSNSTGEHFVAIYVNQTEIFYFDSFAKELTHPDLKLFISKIANRKHFYCNCTPLQSPFSNYCGFYCLGFLISKIRNIKFKQFLQTFSRNDLLKNDRKVLAFILKHIY